MLIRVGQPEDVAAGRMRVFEVAGLHVARETERWEKVLGV